MSDPGALGASIDDLPRDIAALCTVIQGFLIHDAGLALYGLGPADFPQISRQTLPLAERLDQVFTQDAAALSIARPPTARSIATCRDFALLLCGLLRQQAVPSRVRCGFARYFETGRYKDHWVCEYWQSETAHWALADAQLDSEQRAHLAIDFDPACLPDGQFLTAAEAWKLVGSGSAPAELFGHGSASGAWFLRINLLRDLLALRKQETSPWDDWRQAPPESRPIEETTRSQLDDIAARINRVDSDLAGVLALPASLEPALTPFWQVPSLP